YQSWSNNNSAKEVTQLSVTRVAFLNPTQRSEGDRESTELLQMGSAEKYLGEQVLSYVKTQPNDPDVPEALYLLLRMIRYGCNHDDGSSEADAQESRQRIDNIAKTAARLLRQRYAASPWTKKAAPFVR